MLSENKVVLAGKRTDTNKMILFCNSFIYFHFFTKYCKTFELSWNFQYVILEFFFELLEDL